MLCCFITDSGVHTQQGSFCMPSTGVIVLNRALTAKLLHTLLIRYVPRCMSVPVRICAIELLLLLCVCVCVCVCVCACVHVCVRETMEYR
jgi:hypothetical protein